ncbi:hypothetical protein BJ912DRAFT_1070007 [Pholiota molesta]|nr:hypothetical protein BJ912DRAFT_1070007 [Pholiota molesta]
MQFKFFAAALIVCMTAFVSAAPVPVPAAVEAREIVVELNDEVAREAKPVCSRWTCF